MKYPKFWPSKNYKNSWKMFAWIWNNTETKKNISKKKICTWCRNDVIFCECSY